MNYAAKDLLRILALESRRAGAVVVGEDLGTVEKASKQLARHRICLPVAVVSEGPPSQFPERRLRPLPIMTFPLLKVCGPQDSGYSDGLSQTQRGGSQRNLSEPV